MSDTERPEQAEQAEQPEPADQADQGEPRRSRFRVGRAQLLVGLLLGLLGFSVVVQARQTSEGGLGTLRQSELVRLLDNLNEKSAFLEGETRKRQEDLRALESETDSAAVAERVARERLAALSILAGTAPATGPGIRLDITDPDGAVAAALMLDTVQELRDAGAEAIQIGPARVVASTSFVDTEQGIEIDDRLVRAPYEVIAIGDTDTMASALGIPGGVLEALRNAGARGEVHDGSTLTVSALRPVESPQYARPASAGP